MNDLGLSSLVGDINQLTTLGTAVNSGVATGTNWTSLIGGPGPANPAAPGAAPNTTAPALGFTATLKKYAGVIVIGTLSVVVLGVLALKRR